MSIAQGKTFLPKNPAPVAKADEKKSTPKEKPAKEEKAESSS